MGYLYLGSLSSVMEGSIAVDVSDVGIGAGRDQVFGEVRLLVVHGAED